MLPKIEAEVLFDHLRRAQEDRCRHLDPERLGGLEVVGEIERGRLRDR